MREIIKRYHETLSPIDFAPPIEHPNLRTGIGYGHARKSNRERPPKDALKRKRGRTKMSKASRRKNRR